MEYKNHLIGVIGTLSEKDSNKNSNWYRQRNGLPAKKKTLKLPTTKQIEQREKFKLVNGFASKLNEAAKVGFYNQRKEFTANNILVKQILSDTIIGEYPVYGIDYPKVILSKGRVSGLYVVRKEISSTSNLSLYWEDANGVSYLSGPFDTIFLSIYNQTKDIAYNFSGVAIRADLGLSIQIPDVSKGDLLHVWVFFVSESGKDSSNSVYVTLQ